MAQNQDRHCYKIRYKRNVIEYAKKHSSKGSGVVILAATNQKEIIRIWGKEGEDQLKEAKRSKHNLRGWNVKWLEIEE